MASITVLRLDMSEQFNLFYTHEEILDLEKLKYEMTKRAATIDENGRISGQGFLNPKINFRVEEEVLETYGTDLINLGNYFDTKFDDENIITNERQFTFYSKARIIITKDSNLILLFENSTEEKIRSKLKALVEGLGFDPSYLKMDNQLLRKIMDQDIYKWSAAKIDRVDKDGDKTTKVSYEIDSANDVSPSEVDETYREFGSVTNIKFELPLDVAGAPKYITVSLYNNGHRAYFDSNELGTLDISDFSIILAKELNQI